MENKKANIVDQINRGFININSIQKFHVLIEDFSDDPIQKAYADFLVRKKSSAKAALCLSISKSTITLKILRTV